MHAIIRKAPHLPGVGLWSIAGRPLVARQIQWFRTLGCGAIAVELGVDAEGEALARWLRDEDALGAGVLLVPTQRPLSPREIAARAGFPGDAPLLVVPADVLAGGAVGAEVEEARTRGAQLRLHPPPDLGGDLRGATLWVVPVEAAEAHLIEPAGWGVRLRSRADALRLETAILDGRIAPRPDDPSWGIQVHAAETAPGIWIGRGALVEEGATLVPPVLVEAEAVVCGGARVGPRVSLGKRSVVVAGVRIKDATVTAGTIVGEGIQLEGVIVEPFGVRDLTTDALITVGDRMVLDQRGRQRAEGWLSRCLSLLVAALLLPLALARMLRMALTRPRG
jgi:hypothetical protein